MNHFQMISFDKVNNLHENPVAPSVSWSATNASGQERPVLSMCVCVLQEGGDDPTYLNLTVPVSKVLSEIRM